MIFVIKPYGFQPAAVSIGESLHGTGVQCPCRTCFDTCRQLVYDPSVQTIITLVHLGPFFLAELRRTIGTSLQTLDRTIDVAQALVAVNDYNAIDLSFFYGGNGTGMSTWGVLTVVTWRN